MKKYILAIFMILTGAAAIAQAEEREKFWEKVYYGGSFGLSFGTNFTYIDASPLSGYGFTNRLSAGIGATYQYINNGGYSDSNYGGRVFSRFGLLRNVFVHAEYEVINGAPLDLDNFRLRPRAWIDSFFIGPGYSTHIGGQEGMQIYLLFNLTYDELNTLYNEPYVLRVSFTF